MTAVTNGQFDFLTTREGGSRFTTKRQACGGCARCPLMQRKPRIHLVLGGGGAKASAHIGVMRVLEEAGFGIDSIAAASAGALAGLFRCAGYSPEEIVDVMRREMKPRGWRRWLPGGQLFKFLHLLRRGGLQQLIRRHIAEKNLEDLKIPLSVSATDIETGELVILDRGPVETAILATMSLPGAGRPVLRDGRWLVDGSVLCDLPLVKRNPARRSLTIGVQLAATDPGRGSGSGSPSPEKWSSWKVLSQSMCWQLNRMSQESIAQMDVVIRPDTDAYGMADFRNLDFMVAAGEKAAFANMPTLEGIVGSRRPDCARRQKETPATRGETA